MDCCCICKPLEHDGRETQAAESSGLLRSRRLPLLISQARRGPSREVSDSTRIVHCAQGYFASAGKQISVISQLALQDASREPAATVTLDPVISEQPVSDPRHRTSPVRQTRRSCSRSPQSSCGRRDSPRLLSVGKPGQTRLSEHRMFCTIRVIDRSSSAYLDFLRDSHAAELGNNPAPQTAATTAGTKTLRVQ